MVELNKNMKQKTGKKLGKLKLNTDNLIKNIQMNGEKIGSKKIKRREMNRREMLIKHIERDTIERLFLKRRDRLINT